MNYSRPKSIRNWIKDNPNEELYSVHVMEDQTVISAYGRHAQGSGSKVVSWQDFNEGEMNALVEKSMGSTVFDEVKNLVSNLLKK